MPKSPRRSARPNHGGPRLAQRSRAATNSALGGAPSQTPPCSHFSQPVYLILELLVGRFPGVPRVQIFPAGLRPAPRQKLCLQRCWLAVTVEAAYYSRKLGPGLRRARGGWHRGWSVDASSGALPGRRRASQADPAV